MVHHALVGDGHGRILGVPVSLAWHVGWVLATFAALLVLEATRPEPPDEPSA